MALRMTEDKSTTIEKPWSQTRVFLIVVPELGVTRELTHILLRVIFVRKIFFFRILIFFFTDLVDWLIMEADVFILLLTVIPWVFVNLPRIFLLTVGHSFFPSSTTRPACLRTVLDSRLARSSYILIFHVYDFEIRVLIFLFELAHLF